MPSGNCLGSISCFTYTNMNKISRTENYLSSSNPASRHNTPDFDFSALEITWLKTLRLDFFAFTALFPYFAESSSYVPSQSTMTPRR